MNEFEKVSEYFDHWNGLKKELHFYKKRPYFKEREVWWASIGHNLGDEENGKHEHYERPVLIVKRYYQNMFLYLPLTTKIKDGNYYYRKVVNNKDGVVILSQGRVIDAKRLIRKIETMDEYSFENVVKQYNDLI